VRIATTASAVTIFSSVFMRGEYGNEACDATKNLNGLLGLARRLVTSDGSSRRHEGHEEYVVQRDLRVLRVFVIDS
jgi:hypothetical protein